MLCGYNDSLDDSHELLCSKMLLGHKIQHQHRMYIVFDFYIILFSIRTQHTSNCNLYYVKYGVNFYVYITQLMSCHMVVAKCYVVPKFQS